MEKPLLQPNQAAYSTQDLKLSALLLSELNCISFSISEAGNSLKKKITIVFPADLCDDLNMIICKYIDREARVGVFQYNRNLNLLRDALRDH